MDKLSGCRETAYEGKTNDVGAKKQKEQKEQRNKNAKEKAKEIKRKAKEMLLCEVELCLGFILRFV